MSFKVDAVVLVGTLVLLMLGPLVMFTPLLERTKRQDSAAYGLLANQYVFGFEEKWISANAPKTELLGTADIQSLADLANSYSVVRDMRLVPFGLEEVVRLAAVAAAPFLPLTLLSLSVDELLDRLLKTLFR
jgi:hypothetical protein